MFTPGRVLTSYHGGVVGPGLGRGLSPGGRRPGPGRSDSPRPAGVLARWLHVRHARVLRPPGRHCVGACVHRHARQRPLPGRLRTRGPRNSGARVVVLYCHGVVVVTADREMRNLLSLVCLYVK